MTMLLILLILGCFGVGLAGYGIGYMHATIKLKPVVDAAINSVEDNRNLYPEDPPKWTDCGCAGPQTEVLADAISKL